VTKLCGRKLQYLNLPLSRPLEILLLALPLLKRNPQPKQQAARLNLKKQRSRKSL
jgi:hypothetical protein